MDYSNLSDETLQFELRSLFERLHGVRVLIANFDDDSEFEDINDLEGQATGIEFTIEEIEAEIERRKS
jgi:hypothetical protein